MSSKEVKLSLFRRDPIMRELQSKIRVIEIVIRKLEQ